MRTPLLARSSAFAAVTLALLSCPVVARSEVARGTKSLEAYRHFRALSIDLVGRMPTLAELAEFESPTFDEDAWIARHLDGPAYADRLARVYMDLLRLELNNNNSIASDAPTLFRRTVTLPDGHEEQVYFRRGQRRTRIETDGDFCLAPSEVSKSPIVEKSSTKKPSIAPGRTGAPVASASTAPSASTTPRPPAMGGAMVDKVYTTQRALDDNTVSVRPWWLYRDYRNATPLLRYKDRWVDPDPEYEPIDALRTAPDKTPIVSVRVCREEAAIAESGRFFVTGRKAPAAGTPPPFGRVTQPPIDAPYAVQHPDESIQCTNRMAFLSSVECGCGVGLERCVPSSTDTNTQAGSAFMFPAHEPLGQTGPIDSTPVSSSRWYAGWWSREALTFMRHLFAEDRDFREILTSRATWVNGPLAQFYRSIAPTNCCGPSETSFGMRQEREPLFDPSHLPTDLLPHDVSTWTLVPDRGPHAAGILTMPVYLEKYASRRARGATLYSAFLCKAFVAETVELTPSAEPNLTLRPGCSTCHATLEPLAAYFSRVEETNWTFLPPTEFPTTNAACKLNPQGKLSGSCNTFYDPDFTTAAGATLRGAYASPAHADAEPVGAAQAITSAPEFAHCAVERVTSSFLGRAMTPDDAPLLSALDQTFVASGFRMRALVAALVRSRAYAAANDLSSTTLRSLEVTP